MDERPNILLVLTDQHAARVLGCAGDQAADTPALDRLASAGTRFTSCYCASPLCVPSRTALLTGLPPHVSGVRTNDDILPTGLPTIAHSLGAAGYDCRLVGRMHFYGPDQWHGFAERPITDIGPAWPGSGPPDIGPLTAARGNRGPEIAGSGAGETSYQAYDRAVAKEACRTLAELRAERARTGRPWFLVASFFCPHPPFIARREDYDAVAPRVSPPRLPPPKTEHRAVAAWRAAGQTDTVSPEATMRARIAYYGLVRMIDRRVEPLLEAVEDDARTVTVYASDHGEALGERGLWWKSTMFEESAGVPLIVRGAGFAAGAVDDRVASLIDLSATLVALGGGVLSPGHHGRDLGAPRGDWEDVASSEYYGGLMNIDMPLQCHRMVREGHYKLVHYGVGEPTLHDLAADPDETDNLAADPAHAELRDRLLARVLDGWNPVRIAGEMTLAKERASLIRDWVRETRPPEPMRWREPDPSRNRYE
ncbi:MAG: sulfatase-like hydrolase/transferase [Pseudomonadota bacterium]